jgi:cytoskeletal protein CcmA (bactofilin family)
MISEHAVPTALGKSVEIRGEVKGSEDLTIDGRVEGTIVLTDSRLTIGPSAHIDADVSARDIVILGAVNGNVHATARVELRSGANLRGDIFAARLSIEDGSSFIGKVDLTQAGGGIDTSSIALRNGASAPVNPPTAGLFAAE